MNWPHSELALPLTVDKSCGMYNNDDAKMTDDTGHVHLQGMWSRHHP